MNYYNEHDKKTAAWLRELIKAGVLPAGDVDERDTYVHECCDEHASVRYKAFLQEKSRFDSTLVDEALCPVCKALFTLEVERNQSRAQLAAIALAVADYDHPWPNEDELTKQHRLSMLAEFRNLLAVNRCSVDSESTKQHQEVASCTYT